MIFCTSVCTVKFRDIKIPVSNVIGDLGNGFQVTDIFYVILLKIKASNYKIQIC